MTAECLMDMHGSCHDATRHRRCCCSPGCPEDDRTPMLHLYKTTGVSLPSRTDQIIPPVVTCVVLRYLLYVSGLALALASLELQLGCLSNPDADQSTGAVSRSLHLAQLIKKQLLSTPDCQKACQGFRTAMQHVSLIERVPGEYVQSQEMIDMLLHLPQRRYHCREANVLVMQAVLMPRYGLQCKDRCTKTRKSYIALNIKYVTKPPRSHVCREGVYPVRIHGILKANPGRSWEFTHERRLASTCPVAERPFRASRVLSIGGIRSTTRVLQIVMVADLPRGISPRWVSVASTCSNTAVRDTNARSRRQGDVATAGEHDSELESVADVSL
nr:hypothetical protein CFP56_70214 [Quercus suber]